MVSNRVAFYFDCFIQYALKNEADFSLQLFDLSTNLIAKELN